MSSTSFAQFAIKADLPDPAAGKKFHQWTANKKV